MEVAREKQPCMETESEKSQEQKRTSRVCAEVHAECQQWHSPIPGHLQRSRTMGRGGLGSATGAHRTPSLAPGTTTTLSPALQRGRPRPPGITVQQLPTALCFRQEAGRRLGWGAVREAPRAGPQAGDAALGFISPDTAPPYVFTLRGSQSASLTLPWSWPRQSIAKYPSHSHF